MEWTSAFGKDNQPDEKEISKYINSNLWQDINDFLISNYDIQPEYSYSRCSAQPGWNIKYKKAGKSLCILYPMEGYFIALVTIGTKEEPEMELFLSTFTDYVQEVYRTSSGMMGTKWMMIEVRDEHILQDVKQLVQIRRKIKKGV